jgi:hypothetical protein
MDNDLYSEIRKYCEQNQTDILPCARKINPVSKKSILKSATGRQALWVALPDGEELQVGRFRYGPSDQIVVVQRVSGSFGQGAKSFIIVLADGGALWKLWRGQHELADIPAQDHCVLCKYPSLQPGGHASPLPAPGLQYGLEMRVPKDAVHADQKLHDSFKSKPELLQGSVYGLAGIDEPDQKMHHAVRSENVGMGALQKLGTKPLEPALTTGSTIVVSARRPLTVHAARAVVLKSISRDMQDQRTTAHLANTTDATRKRSHELPLSTSSEEPMAESKKRIKVSNASLKTVLAERATAEDSDSNKPSADPCPSHVSTYTPNADLTTAADSDSGRTESLRPSPRLPNATEALDGLSPAHAVRPVYRLSDPAPAEVSSGTPSTPLQRSRDLLPTLKQDTLAALNVQATSTDRTLNDVAILFVDAADKIVEDSSFSEIQDSKNLFARALVLDVVGETSILLKIRVGGTILRMQKGWEKDFDGLKTAIARFGATEIVVAAGG